MGRGIAQAFALGGWRALLIDAKTREKAKFEELRASALSEIGDDLNLLASIGVGDADTAHAALTRVRVASRAEGEQEIGAYTIVFEGVPETLEAKQEAFVWASAHCRADAVIASTTSTLSVDALAALIEHPERFLNAHWLNPAALMPLVEVARGKATSGTAVASMKAALESIGKTSVVMTDTPGYVVPRIQALAMNEAARLYEEGVASAEDIDKAIRLGFGIRYAILGMLEFIDFGGNDILYHASNHLSRTVDTDRYRAPDVVVNNMRDGRNGMRAGAGYFDWVKIDVRAYRQERLSEFVRLLGFLKLLPKAAGVQEEEP
jgi:3-hydroxybutyryl-CoA dehydrogenase